MEHIHAHQYQARWVLTLTQSSTHSRALHVCVPISTHHILRLSMLHHETHAQLWQHALSRHRAASCMPQHKQGGVVEEDKVPWGTLAHCSKGCTALDIIQVCCVHMLRGVCTQTTRHYFRDVWCIGAHVSHDQKHTTTCTTHRQQTQCCQTLVNYIKPRVLLLLLSIGTWTPLGMICYKPSRCVMYVTDVCRVGQRLGADSHVAFMHPFIHIHIHTPPHSLPGDSPNTDRYRAI